MTTKKESIGPRYYDEQQVMRLGRTLRKFSRTSRYLMELLDIDENDVKVLRKKKGEESESRPQA